MNGTKEDYINYRLERAIQTLNDASTLITQKSWNSAINRLYYACFYSAQALLLKHSINAKTHSGTKAKFFQQFIQTRIIEKEYSRLYSDLFDWRQQGDYADFIEFDQETVEPLPARVADFIEIVKNLL